MQQVMDDLMNERIDGSTNRAKQNSYMAKLESLAVMDVAISKETLCQRVTRQYKKMQQHIYRERKQVKGMSSRRG